MSLDKHEAIPVDTHVWQIAVREYMPQLKNHKTLTDKLYNQIGKNFLFCNFYRRATKLGEGNVFTGFCQSFCQSFCISGPHTLSGGGGFLEI